MVCDWPPGTQLDTSHELHATTYSSILVCVLLDPLHEVHRVRVIELPQVLHLLGDSDQ